MPHTIPITVTVTIQIVVPDELTVEVEPPQVVSPEPSEPAAAAFGMVPASPAPNGSAVGKDMAERHAHAEKHIPELRAFADRLLRQNFPYPEIKARMVARAGELAREDPPDADPNS